MLYSINKLSSVTSKLIGLWVVITIIGPIVIGSSGLHEHRQIFIIFWVGLFGATAVLPGLYVIKNHLPFILRICKSYLGVAIIGVISTSVIIYSSNQADQLVFSVFHFNPKYLPTSTSFLAVGLMIINWLTVLTITLFFSILLLMVVLGVFTLCSSFLGVFFSKFGEKLKLSFQYLYMIALGWAFWAMIFVLVQSLPHFFDINYQSIIKSAGVAYDYYPSASLNYPCIVNPIKYPKFTWLGGGKLSVVTNGGRLKFISCRKIKGGG